MKKGAARPGGSLLSLSLIHISLAKLIDRQSQTDEIMLVNSEKVETIIRSLLSSPCNFTPLLHFVVPVQMCIRDSGRCGQASVHTYL